MIVTSRLPRAAATLSALVMLAACQPSGNPVNTGSDSSSSTSDITTGSNQYTVEQKVARITFTGRAGTVSVSAQENLGVKEDAKYGKHKPVTSHAVNGDTLELKEDGCPYREPGEPCQVAWTIGAPPDTVLELETDAGQIEIARMAGKITARSRAGGIDAEELRSPQVDATAESGGVRLDFAVAPNDVSATTGAGQVQITVPAGDSYAVRAQTGAGQTRIDVPQDPSSPRRVKMQTGAGGVELATR